VPDPSSRSRKQWFSQCRTVTHREWVRLGVKTEVTDQARKFQAFLVIALLSVPCFAQKIEVGHDKSTDFSRYKSFTLHVPETSGTPFLYMTVVSTITTEIESKGLAKMESNGDLEVRAIGSFDYGSGGPLTADACQNCKAPLVDPMEWTGKMAAPGLSSTPLPKGVLELVFVDPATNKVVWAGTVAQKLDPEKKQKSLEKAQAAVKKLLMNYPPTGK
jgi:hypothetical protein